MDKNNELKKQLNEYIEKALCNYDLPGLAIGADVFGEFSYIAAAGYRDMPERKSLNPDNVFHMASVSKVFTGMSILKLEEEGKLSIDDDITNYFGFLPYENISVKKLLTHTAGLGDVEDYGWDKPRIDTHALRDYIESAESKNAQVLEQGNFVYSNIGFEILGSLVSELSGMSYEDFVLKNFLKPAGMCSSTFLVFTRTEHGKLINPDAASENDIEKSLDIKALGKAGVCMPHVKDSERMIVREKHFPYNRMHGPSSTLTSNIVDMRKFAKLVLDREAVGGDSYAKMWQENARVPNNGEHIGLAWFIREQDGFTLCGHEGTDDGFRASFWICPELNAQVTVVANITKAPVKKINKHVFELLFSGLR